MSAKKKPKKLRRPNIAIASVGSGPAESRGGGHESPLRVEAGRGAFDYTHVRQDLRRIGILAGGIVTLLVVLSFFIR